MSVYLSPSTTAARMGRRPCRARSAARLIELDDAPDAIVPSDDVAGISRFDKIGGRTLRTESQEMRRDGGRLHAGSRRSGELNLHIAWHIARAVVSLILGEDSTNAIRSWIEWSVVAGVVSSNRKTRVVSVFTWQRWSASVASSGLRRDV